MMVLEIERGIEFGSFDGKGDGEYNGAGFVEISTISVMWDKVFLGTGLFARVYYISNVWMSVYKEVIGRMAGEHTR